MKINELEFTMLFILATFAIILIIATIVEFIKVKILNHKMNRERAFIEFRKFLNEKGLVTLFGHQLQKAISEKHITVEKYKQLQKFENIHLILERSFNWNDSTKPFMEWWKINEEWQLRLRQFKSEISQYENKKQRQGLYKRLCKK